ncbi:hypothetical protein ABIE50_005203 [Chitinophaga sp. OAE865]
MNKLVLPITAMNTAGLALSTNPATYQDKLWFKKAA